MLLSVGSPDLGSAEGGHPDLFRLAPISLRGSKMSSRIVAGEESSCVLLSCWGLEVSEEGHWGPF